MLGLAFGSFLNVFLIRFPEEESLATPRSHCRHCDHTLAWWENIPVLSWLILRGRCRQCRAAIGIRYPAIEFLVGLLWAACFLNAKPTDYPSLSANIAQIFLEAIGFSILCWLLVALAVLDFEYLWLPDVLTLPGTALGFAFTLARFWPHEQFRELPAILHLAWTSILAILAATAIVLLIRLLYWIVRRQEGMGLGDAKLMAMLGAWLGLQGSIETFILAIFAGSAVALIWLLALTFRKQSGGWSTLSLPFGTVLCACALLEIFSPHWLMGNWQLLI
ncbi:prepilin peptidase [Acidicapsa dinghuensis]|uniref:Prepilin peptidase n=1 Tax=Acidicapsa dinghuensis TaxID=2218256 RepID=A0ABW1ELG8_9BACT|nr:A24 family peptidase [Acidicapsa dinghuensis]